MYQEQTSLEVISELMPVILTAGITLSIIILIINIVFFFKIWNATTNIKEIRWLLEDKFQEKSESAENTANSPTSSGSTA